MQKNEWIEWVWTEEKPYPETLETYVNVKTRDGWDDAGLPGVTVGWWHDKKSNLSRWYSDGSGANIVAYRVATNTPRSDRIHE